MNPSSDIGSDTPAGAGAGSKSSNPSNWREGLMALIASRFELIQIESKEAAKEGARRATLIAIAVISVGFAWALLLAGVISILAVEAGWPWNYVAVGAALLHLLVAIILAMLAKSSKGSAFPVTRAEFHKDREWIENFQNPKKSKN